MLKHGDFIIFGKDPTKFTFLYPEDKIGAPTRDTTKTSSNVKQRDYKISLVDGSQEIDGLGPRSMQTAEFGSLNRQQKQDSQNRRQHYNTPPIGSPQQDNFRRIPDFDQNQSKLGASPHQQLNLKQLQHNQSGQSVRRDVEAQEFYKLQSQNDNLEIHGKLLEREEALLKRESELRLAQNEIESLREDNEKLRSKLKAVELYASEIQRKNDMTQRELAEKNSVINDLQNTDFAQKSNLNENEIKSLRKLLVSKEDEIGSLKRQLQAVLQTQRDGSINSNHYQQFLEQQAKELANTKKQLVEYENRNDECKRKWNSLVKENMAKEEKIKGLTLQLNRQIENYQELFNEQDRKLTAAHVKYLELVSKDPESQEREAAEFLVEQMKGMQEERAKIAIENEQLHLQTQDLIDEIRNLNDELDSFQKYIDDNPANSSNYDHPRPQISNSKLKRRVEELEDLIHELKQRENVSKLVELNDVISHLEQKLANEIALNEELKNRFNNYAQSLNTVSEQNTIDFFSKLLEEKDQKIIFLQKQNEFLNSKEKQYQLEVDKLREANKQLSFQFEGFKAKHAKIEDVLSRGAGSYQSLIKDDNSRADPNTLYTSNRQPDPMILGGGGFGNLSENQDRTPTPNRIANFLGNYPNMENNMY